MPPTSDKTASWPWKASFRLSWDSYFARMTFTPSGKVEVEPWRERTVVLNEESLRKAFKMEGPRLPLA